MPVERESTVIELACGLVTELESGMGELHLLGLLSLHFDCCSSIFLY